MASSGLSERRSMTLFVRALLFALLFASSPGLANGQSAPANTAGLYIDLGDGEQTLVVVPFPEDSISSLELLERSELPLLTVGFGGLGDAVCAIETTGCELSECRRTLCQDGDRNAPFWQFLQSSDDGSWATSPLGSSAASVKNGDVDAWVWTGTTPSLPSISLDELVTKTGYLGDMKPAVFSNHDGSDISNTGWSSIGVGIGVMIFAVAVGTGLLVIQKRKHAAR